MLNVVIFHDYWVMKRKLTCTNYFILLEKKIFKRAHQKSKCLCLGSPRRHILSCGISSPPLESQLAFHIYNVKFENTHTCKRISWDSGGGGGGGGGNDVLKIFFYYLYV